MVAIIAAALALTGALVGAVHGLVLVRLSWYSVLSRPKALQT